MMDEAQKALKSLEKFNVAKHKYESLNKSEGTMICFFEGKHDKDYYKTHIRTICGEIIDITCHCKKNVLSMYNLIHERDKGKYRLAYFIDRDFDDLVTNPDIFETDGYAIENYYCSRSAFSRYMTDFLNVDSASADYGRAMDFYDNQYSLCHDVVSTFNHYYSAIKRLERNGGASFSIEAGDNFPLELGSIGVNNYSKNYNLEKLNELFGSTIDEASINVEIATLDANPALYYRGKYEIQELENILTYIIKEAAGQRGVAKENRILQKNPGVSCIQSAMLMLGLSPMADVTQNLRSYLSKFVD